jgi:nitroreductase
VTLESNRMGYLSSPKLRLAIALIGATLLVWSLPESRLRTPIMLIALGLPLIFRLVPRNWLYGMRTPRTLWTTEETWYRQNIITGVAMVGVGVVWLGVLALRG